MQPLQTIRIGRESWCLPYAGFLYCALNVLLYFCYVKIYYKDIETNKHKFHVKLLQKNSVAMI